MDPHTPGPGADRPSWWAPALVLAVALPVLTWLLRAEGRIWTCRDDSAWLLWCGEAWSRHTSQHFLDPYSFTHFLHGFLFCAAFHLLGRGRIPLPWLFCLAVLGEGVWELFENSSYVVARYRANTASLDYAGDAILNSFGDLVSCGTGLLVAHRLGLRRALAVFVAVELFLLAWIRDCLLINILMLVHPVEAIKAWQRG